MAITIKKAVKHESKLRLAIIAPSGAGKTFTALTLARTLAQGKPIAVIDTERGSASKYADLFDFDVVELDSFSPRQYVEALKELERAGYAVIVIDSLSHAWMGAGGALEMVDKARARERNNNSFTAWRDVTPEHNALIDAILASKAHVIATMRQKTEYVLESVMVDGKTKQVPRKVGLAPIQRDGMEYEFDVVADMDQENTMVVTKSRCPAISNEVIKKPGAALGETLLTWLPGAPVPAIPEQPSLRQPAQASNPPASVPRPVTPASTPNPVPARPAGQPEGPTDPMTERQAAAIRNMAGKQGLDEFELEKRVKELYGISFNLLNGSSAAHFIKVLQGR